MRKTAVVVFVALAVLAAAACKDSVTGPRGDPRTPAKAPANGSTGSIETIIDIADLMGTWQATKTEVWDHSRPDSRRDLLAEGGTVTLVLVPNSQGLGNAVPDGKYTVTVAMPGAEPGVDTGFWFYSQYSIETGYSNCPQIDFYPASLGPTPEYGQIPAFLVALNGDTLKLWDSGMTFLPFDFGWDVWQTGMSLEFSRR
jgi:hypothetical protein